MQGRHLPNEPDATPADSQCVQRRRRRRRDDRDALNSGSPPENIRPVPQRLSRSGAQEGKHCLRTIHRGQSRQHRPMLGQGFHPTLCRSPRAGPRHWPEGPHGVDQPDAAPPGPQFTSAAHADQAEPRPAVPTNPTQPNTLDRSNNALTNQAIETQECRDARMTAPANAGDRNHEPARPPAIPLERCLQPGC